MRTAQLTAITEAIDIDQLAEVIPTVLGGLRQVVDVPMLRAALNVDVELTGQAVTKATADREDPGRHLEQSPQPDRIGHPAHLPSSRTRTGGSGTVSEPMPGAS